MTRKKNIRRRPHRFALNLEQRAFLYAFAKALRDMAKKGVIDGSPFALAPASEIDVQSPEHDALRAFLAARTRSAPGHRVGATELYQAYLAWCAGNDAPALPSKAFVLCLKSLGIQRIKSSRQHWLNLVLVPATPTAGNAK